MSKNISKPFNITLSLINIDSMTSKYKCFYGEDIQLLLKVVDEFKIPVNLLDMNARVYYVNNGASIRQDDNITITDAMQGRLKILVKRNYMRLGSNTIRVVLYDEDEETMLQPFTIECIDTDIMEEVPPEDPEYDYKSEIYKAQNIANTNQTNIGDISTLKTTAKSDLVSGINEIVEITSSNKSELLTNIGDMNTLKTTVKSDLVSGINEIVDIMSSNKSELLTNIETNTSQLLTKIETNTSQLEQIVNTITSYGAKPNDLNFDNATIIQTVLNMQGEFAKVQIPKGSFFVNSPIIVTNKIGLQIVGSGQLVFGVNGSLTFNSCQFTIIDGVSFDGTFQTSTSKYMLGFSENESHPKVINCNFRNINGKSAIYADKFKGSFASEGVTIDNCLFQDQKYWGNGQTCIEFGEDGEYSTISKCKFYRVVTGIVMGNGSANNSILDNIFMYCKGDVVGDPPSGALIRMFGEGTNSGKTIIRGNKFNHNYGKSACIYGAIKTGKNEGSFHITGNFFEINGNYTNSCQIALVNAFDSIVSENHFQPANNVIITEPCVWFYDTPRASFINNNINSDIPALKCDNSTVYVNGNKYGGVTTRTTNKYIFVRNGKVIHGKKTYKFSLNSATGGFIDTLGIKDITTTLIKGGVVKVNHNLGSTNYSVNANASVDSSNEQALLCTIYKETNSFTIKLINATTNTLVNTVGIIGTMIIGEDVPCVWMEEN